MNATIILSPCHCGKSMPLTTLCSARKAHTGGRRRMDRTSVDWRGYIPGITTPFTQDRRLDEGGYHRLLEWLDGEGMHGIVVAGTTGEWFTLTDDERRTLYRIAGEHLAGKRTLLAGCNAFCAARVAVYAQMAKEARFDGILVTPPPYVVPSEEEIFQFYREISASV